MIFLSLGGGGVTWPDFVFFSEQAGLVAKGLPVKKSSLSLLLISLCDNEAIVDNVAVNIIYNGCSLDKLSPVFSSFPTNFPFLNAITSSPILIGQQKEITPT